MKADKARPFQDMQLRLAHLNVLLERLLNPLPIEEKLKLITQTIVTVFDADFARIWVVRPGDLCETGCIHRHPTDGGGRCADQEKCLHICASEGRYTHLDGLMHRRVPFGSYKIGLVAASKEEKFITNDVLHDPKVHDHQWVRDLGLVAFAGYRLASRDGRPMGVLGLFSKHPIGSEEDALLQSLANTAAMVLQAWATDETLRRKEEELNRYFGSSLDLLCIADTDGYFRRLNPEWEKTLGYPLSELEGKQFLDLVHPDDLAATIGAVDMLSKQKEVTGFINRYRCKDGSYRWIEWRSFPSGQRIYAVARDITGR